MKTIILPIIIMLTMGAVFNAFPKSNKPTKQANCTYDIRLDSYTCSQPRYIAPSSLAKSVTRLVAKANNIQ